MGFWKGQNNIQNISLLISVMSSLNALKTSNDTQWTPRVPYLQCRIWTETVNTIKDFSGTGEPILTFDTSLES